MSLSVFYFQYKQVSGHEGIVGRLSEAEIMNLLPRTVDVATPEIYPPGSIVWNLGELTPEEIERCRWMTFLTQIDTLVWEDGVDKSRPTGGSGDSAKGLRCLLCLRRIWCPSADPHARQRLGCHSRSTGV